MKAIPRVTRVEHLGDHRLRLEFDDGLVRDIDFKNMLWGPVMQPLKDPAFFARAFVDPTSETVTWPNQVDLDPAVLHGDADPNDGEPLSVLAEYRR